MSRDGAVPIRGLLLDAGGVIWRPLGGRWNPRFDFEAVLARFDPARDPALDPARFAAAVVVGDRFLDEAPATANRDDYHRAVLAVLGIDAPPASLLVELNRPLTIPHLELFPEVLDVLEQARQRGMRIAMVSDNWSGPKAGQLGLGLNPYFDICVISEDLGVRKPHPLMYSTGAAGIGIPAEACLFVDDDPELVEAALALGYQAVALGRTLPHPPGNAPWIETLDGILPLIDAQAG